MTGLDRFSRVLLCGSALASLLLVAGCGGGTTGDVTSEPLTPTLQELSGTVTDGRAVPSDLLLQVTVKGNVGTARTAENRRDELAGNYLASVDQLTGPYLLHAVGGEIDDTISVATSAGTANVTSLTTLVAAQLLAQDPFAYFETLAGRGGFTAATDASIADAVLRVRRTLQRDHGFDVPASLGDFITTPFQPVVGDTMFDTLKALDASLAAAGTDYRALSGRVAEEAARCRLESVQVTRGAAVDPFCPFARQNETDPDDAGISVIGFDNLHGDALTVRTRGEGVLSVQWVAAEAAGALTYTCQGAACAGVSLGAPAADGARPVNFAGVTLRGPTGSAVLQGTLQSSAPGITLPGLPCSANRYYLVHPDRTVDGWCALPDDFGLGAAGRSVPSGSTRLAYVFDGDNAGVSGPSIEVMTQGDSVLRVLVYTMDPDSGALLPLYQCRDGGCAGASLGPVRVDESLGIPIELRDVVLDEVRLPAVLADGSLSSTESVSLQASLTGYVVKDPFALPLLPEPCAAGSPVVTASLSEQATPLQVCTPDDSQGFTLSGSFVDEAGDTGLFILNLLSDGAGSYSQGDAVNVVMRGSAVVRVSFDPFGGPSYVCEASACTGVTVSAPNAAGERTVSLAGTALRELGTAGLLADRTASLTGSFVAPPP